MLKTQPNPMISQCYPHLQIDGQVIVNELQASLYIAFFGPRVPYLHAKETQMDTTQL